MRKNITTELPNNTHVLCTLREELLAEANQALRDKVDWVINWYKNDTKNSLLSRWQLGAQVAEIIQDQRESGCRTYGTRAFQTIALFSGEAEGSLRVCARMAHCYNEREIIKLSELTMADGLTPISFSHMRALISLDSPEKRQEALELTLERCWTAEQLSKYVKAQTGARNTNNPDGRPVAIPRDLNAVIDQQLSFADDFDKRNTRVWNNPAHSVATQMIKLPKEQYTEDLATKLSRLAHQMEVVSQEAMKRRAEALEKWQEVRNELDSRYANGVRLLAEVEQESMDATEAHDESLQTEQRQLTLV